MRFRPLVLVALALLTAACAPTPTAGSTVPTTSLSPASATAATTATTATATLSTSAGKVVDLPGVEFSTAAQINATAWLASDAKAFLVGELELDQQDGNDCGVLEVSGYRVPDLINGAEFSTDEPNCAGPGAGFLWGKIAGKWGVVIGGQAEPVCSDIRDAGWTSTIPKEFYGGQCMEKGAEVIYKP